MNFLRKKLAVPKDAEIKEKVDKMLEEKKVKEEPKEPEYKESKMEVLDEPKDEEEVIEQETVQEETFDDSEEGMTEESLMQILTSLDQRIRNIEATLFKIKSVI